MDMAITLINEDLLTIINITRIIYKKKVMEIWYFSGNDEIMFKVIHIDDIKEFSME